MTLLADLEPAFAAAFRDLGADPALGRLKPSDRPDMGQFQCNGAMAAGGALKRKPRDIAEAVVEALRQDPRFKSLTIAGPGFINVVLADDYIVQRLEAETRDDKLGATPAENDRPVILDFGGPNVAKAMHVGHLRSLIIGDSLQRTLRFTGARVISDVHLGDWGLPMGQLIEELRLRNAQLPYFDPEYSGPYPDESPVSLDDLQDLYTAASRRTKEDASAMEAAREATRELQLGRPGYLALWNHFVAVSRKALEDEFGALGVKFDLWEGESTVNETVEELGKDLTARGLAVRDAGALIIPVARPDDVKEMPPLIFFKSDGAMLYGTTDLATIKRRVDEYHPARIIYVVDQRQHLHFEQVFRAADLVGLGQDAKFEHVGFGTVNGPDGKPFKTRAGGTMRLNDLLTMALQEATARLDEGQIGLEFAAEERAEIARKIGIGSIKFADLMNNRLSNYIFDIARFTSFEGKTGPYVMYAAVRIKSVLRKAAEQSIDVGELRAPTSEHDLKLMLRLAQFGDVVRQTLDTRSPHLLCDYAYALGQEFSRFYHECPILIEPDAVQRGAYLALVRHTLTVLEQTLRLLGIETPERM